MLKINAGIPKKLLGLHKFLFQQVNSEGLNLARLSHLIRRELRAQTKQSAQTPQHKVIVIVVLKSFVIGFWGGATNATAPWGASNIE